MLLTGVAYLIIDTYYYFMTVSQYVNEIIISSVNEHVPE